MIKPEFWLYLLARSPDLPRKQDGKNEWRYDAVFPLVQSCRWNPLGASKT